MFFRSFYIYLLNGRLHFTIAYLEGIYRLKIWAADTNSTSKKFYIESDSFENPTTASVSTSAAATSAEQTNFVSITGLIYPTTEPFKQYAIRIEIRVPPAFPQEPPEIYMKMKIRHPNVKLNGK